MCHAFFSDINYLLMPTLSQRFAYILKEMSTSAKLVGIVSPLTKNLSFKNSKLVCCAIDGGQCLKVR